MKKKKDGLLCELAYSLNLDYLSDLTNAKYRRSLCNVILDIPMDKYDIMQWNYAITYIERMEQVDRKVYFETVLDARNFLLQK